MLLFSLFVNSSCSMVADGSKSCSTATQDTVATLVNQTDEAIIYVALNLESYELIDINPSISLEGGQNYCVIHTEDSASVGRNDIAGYSMDDGIAFLLYAVADGEAHYRRSLLVTKKELESHNFRVEVQTLNRASK